MTKMGMTVQVQWTRATKTSSCPNIHSQRMDIADKLACAAAYRARYEDQTFLNIPSEGILREGAAERFLKSKAPTKLTGGSGGRDH